MKPRKRPNASCPKSSAQPWPVRQWLWALVLVTLVAVVYWPTLDNGYIWDDDDYVEQNFTLRTTQGLADIWFKLGAVPQYYPLVHTTFWVEYRLWGLRPRGYHVVNLLLHATAAVLVWRVLARLAAPGAWLAAAVFAVHPVEVESVAWITERKNVLSCALALAALLAYWRFSPPEEPSPQQAARHRAWGYYALALALFVAALLSKTVVVSLPAVLLVIYWWKRGTLPWREAVPLLPFFAVGVTLALVTVWMEKVHVGAQGEEWNLSPVDRVLIAGRALWFYAGKLVWPRPLVFFYPRWSIDATQAWQYLFPLAALAVIAALWALRDRLGRGPLAAVLIFAGVLTPALGFFDVFPFRYSFVADHFQYHASIALIALLVAAGIILAGRFRLQPTASATLAAVLVVALTLTAHQRTYAYRDLPTLYYDTVASNPECWAAQTTLGNILSREGKFDEALTRLREAVRLAPERLELRNNLGAALVLKGDYDEAIAVELEVLRLKPLEPTALYNYGVALGGKGDLAAGIDQVRQAIQRNPRLDIAHHELGAMLMALGKTTDALAPYEEAARLKPTNARYRESLAKVLTQLGQFDRAERELRDALQWEPQSAEAYYLIGVVALGRGNAGAAANSLNSALRINPRHAQAAALLQHLRSGGPSSGGSPGAGAP